MRLHFDTLRFMSLILEFLNKSVCVVSADLKLFSHENIEVISTSFTALRYIIFIWIITCILSIMKRFYVGETVTRSECIYYLMFLKGYLVL